MEKEEIKIKYKKTQSLSSFFIHNLAQVLEPSVSVQHKQAKDDIIDAFNIEIKYPGEIEIYGELSAAVVICSKAKNGPAKFCGHSLFLDHWIFYFTNEFREIAEKVVFDNDKSSRDDIKNAIKDIETHFSSVLNPDHKGPVEVLAYCYLSPLLKLLSGKFQTLIKKIGETCACLSPDDFFKKSQKKIEFSQSKAKLVRLNKGKEILPVSGKRNILITSALPYVNNVPHLGNIIGCVLSADVYARFCRLAGYNTIYICGTDEYGTATETKALEENKTCKEICDYYFKIHKEIYEWFDCDFDHFGRTTTQEQTNISQKIFWDCYNNGFTYQETKDQLFWEKWVKFLADRLVFGTCYLCKFDDAKGDQWDKWGKLLDSLLLIDPKCKVCSSSPIIKQSTNINLDLTNIQEKLEKWVDESSVKGEWSKNSISTTKAWLKEGLKGRCITRDLKWGTPVPLEGFTDKVFYVWFDAPIGYLSITNTFTQNWEKWWKNPEEVQLYQFMGKDNVPFHWVVFPSTLIASQDNWTLLHHINTTEYLNYESGKFSKTRGIGVFGDQAAQTGINSEVWRYYLLSIRPETQDSLFNWDDFASRNNNELIANLGNCINRVLPYIFKNFKATVPERKTDFTDVDTSFLNDYLEKLEAYFNAMENVKIKDGLKIAMSISSAWNGYIQLTEPFKLFKTDYDRCCSIIFIIINAIRLLGAIFEPFIPSFSAKLYEQLNIQRTEKDEVLLESAKSKSIDFILSLIPAGHTINQPTPIFRNISDEDIQKWRSMFSGKQ